MTDTGMTQNNFILPAPRVGGLPLSQDWLDRMKFVRDRTVPITLPSGNDILTLEIRQNKLSGLQITNFLEQTK